jgi:hypothetical protein
MAGTLTLAGTALSLWLAGAGADGPAPAQPRLGEDAPAFDLRDVRGGRLSLRGLRGRFVVLHFGTSW